MLELLLAAGVLLTIIDLIVRDQTQYRVARLKTELLALRSEEKRLAERRDEVELMVAQIGDALMRADRRRNSAAKASEEVGAMLDELDRLAAGKGGDDEVMEDEERSDPR
ncbi:MAG: hypothetical protein ABIL09_02770 [Gemmatimonadota bacterium]